MTGANIDQNSSQIYSQFGLTGGFTNYDYYDPNTNAYDVIDLEQIHQLY